MTVLMGTQGDKFEVRMLSGQVGGGGSESGGDSESRRGCPGRLGQCVTGGLRGLVRCGSPPPPRMASEEQATVYRQRTPTNEIHSHNVVSMLGQRRRQGPSIKTTLGQRLVSRGQQPCDLLLILVKCWANVVDSIPTLSQQLSHTCLHG